MAVPPAVIELLARFLATTTGRDRINRFLQYAARAVAANAQRLGAPEAAGPAAALSAAAAQTRRLMRVGRQLEFALAASRALTLRDEIARTAAVTKNTGLALWLCYDFFGWLQAAGIAKFDGIKEIGRRANKAWFVALVASFLGNLHQIRLISLRIAQEVKLHAAVKAKRIHDDSVESVSASIASLKSERGKLVFAAVQDALDIMIPASNLEYVKIDPGLVGIIGAITSIMGGYTQWKAVSK